VGAAVAADGEESEREGDKGAGRGGGVEAVSDFSSPRRGVGGALGDPAHDRVARGQHRGGGGADRLGAPTRERAVHQRQPHPYDMLRLRRGDEVLDEAHLGRERHRHHRHGRRPLLSVGHEQPAARWRARRRLAQRRTARRRPPPPLQQRDSSVGARRRGRLIERRAAPAAERQLPRPRPAPTHVLVDEAVLARAHRQLAAEAAQQPRQVLARAREVAVLEQVRSRALVVAAIGHHAALAVAPLVLELATAERAPALLGIGVLRAHHVASAAARAAPRQLLRVAGHGVCAVNARRALVK
jgi:hypothetical protein